jgi:hypothetical protein
MKATHLVRVGGGLALVAGLAGIGGPSSAATNISLGVPVPAGVTSQPDPACAKDPGASFCTSTARYVVAWSPVTARNQWLPGLAKWGMTKQGDTCTAANVNNTGFCVVRGVRTGTKVMIVFRAEYAKQYAPAAVKSQVAAVQRQANRDAARAATATARRTVLQTAAKKIAAIKATAVAYNNAHPKSVVTVTFHK